MNLVYKEILNVEIWHDYYLREVLYEAHEVIQAIINNSNSDGLMAAITQILADDSVLDDEENKPVRSILYSE